jgi:LysR family transcriptional regulator, nitrogen assimilation regulatory protein
MRSSGRQNMDFRQIKYFIAIAEHGSLSAASDVIHIAQPALSTQTSNLESELGVMLFNRHGRGVTLTPAGKIFLKHAYRIRDEITAAKNAVMKISSDCAGIVYLGLPMTTSTVFAVPIIEHVRKAYPLIDLRIVDGMSADVCSWLLEGRLDVAVLYEAHNSIAKSAMPLLEDELYLVGLKGSELEGIDEIEFADLVKFPLIASSGPHALRRLLDETALRLGTDLDYVHVIDSIPQLRGLVLRDAGYTILPRIAFADVPQSDRLLFVRLKNPDLRLRSWLALTPRREASHAAMCVHSLILKTLFDLVEAGRWLGGFISKAES